MPQLHITHEYSFVLFDVLWVGKKLKMKLKMIKLIVLSVLSALLLSRIGLIVHEFLGHALVAHWCGASIDSCCLSMFGGGYVALRETRFLFLPALLIMSGGWIFEIILGVSALTLAQQFKRKSTLHFFLLSLGSVVIIHAFYYAITGVFYGYGDGRLFYRYYKNYIYWLTPGVVLLFMVVAFWLTRLWGNNFSKWLPNVKPIHKICIALSCIVVAGTVHLALFMIEEHYYPSETRNVAMETESSRQVNNGMLEYMQEVTKNGNALTNQELSMKKADLEAKYNVFPLSPVLMILLFLSIIVGINQSDTYDENTSIMLPRWRSLALLASCLIGFLVIIELLPNFTQNALFLNRDNKTAKNVDGH